MAEAVRHDKTARQLRMLSDALDSGRLGPVRRLINTLAPAEIGNLLESLPPGKREVVWGLVDAEDDGEVLLHVGDEVRESLLAEMDPDEIVAAVEDLDIDDLADLVEDLPDTVIDEVLKSMDRENRERLEQVLSYAEDTAGRLMNPDVVTVRADVNVDVVLRYLRLRGELPDGRCAYPDYWEHASESTEQHLRLQSKLFQAETCRFARELSPLPNGLRQHLTVTFDDDNRFTALYEQLPILLKGEDPTIEFLVDGAWQKTPGRCQAVRVDNLVTIAFTQPQTCSLGPETTLYEQRLACLLIHLGTSFQAGDTVSLVYDITGE